MITLCIALHLYAGPIEPSTPVTVLAESCEQVKLAKAERAIKACAKQGAERCEVLTQPGRVLIERKVSTR